MTGVAGYIRERDFTVCDTVGLCALTKEQFVKETFNLPVEPVSATVVLVGIPAVVSAKEDAGIAEIYNKATMAVIDGMPIIKMARRKGFNAERCAAPDIMGPVFEESVRQDKTHFFYGGKNDQVLKKLCDNLERNFQGIRIMGMYSPPFRPLTAEEDDSLCQEINSLHPDFLWVGIGAPKQEMWMSDHQGKIHHCVMLGVGAGFDFLAGTLNKAPVWMEKCCLEWFYRLCKEPGRLWRRYLIGGFKYLFYSFLQLTKASGYHPAGQKRK
jgi:N-acetylglucosaminyldiphosphoundecaprenol N-acetyl-beta-D-mannosaminyltransferase